MRIELINIDGTEVAITMVNDMDPENGTMGRNWMDLSVEVIKSVAGETIAYTVNTTNFTKNLQHP